ncbi:MAG: hypothetical protein RBS07_14095 [Lentimicrobium sp.]|jgi:hypothetical protein|nr:hypothetical protein [Lentimicrobium sp.]
MKKLFTLLVLSVLCISATFAVKNCVFIVAANADPLPDQNIINHLSLNGYNVTVFVANGTVPAGEYDLAVLSETIGSTASTWAAFRTAPIPFVALKTFAARGHNNALKWLATSVTGIDYANTTDISVKTAAPTHPILDGIPTDPAFHYQTVPDASTNPVAMQWLNFPTVPSGATVITTVTIGTGTSYTLEGPIPQTIAFEKNTTMNTFTIANRAVISGFNYFANPQLTAEGLKLIKQACDWVTTESVASGTKDISVSLLSKSGSELLNPTNAEVDIYAITGACIHRSNQASIQLNQLPKGVYIAKTNIGVLKFVL